MSDLPTADQMTVTKIRERLEARGSTNNHAIARFYTYAPADIAFLLTQLSQVLRELEAARSHGSALLRDVEHAEAQLATALRELGEARADAENARGQLAIAAIMSQMLSADRDAALRSTAELTREYGLLVSQAARMERERDDERTSNAELRGALEHLKTMLLSEKMGEDWLSGDSIRNARKIVRTALASSSTKET